MSFLKAIFPFFGNEKKETGKTVEFTLPAYQAEITPEQAEQAKKTISEKRKEILGKLKSENKQAVLKKLEMLDNFYKDNLHFQILYLNDILTELKKS